uniref:G-protein coupled receptors family 1 profile domain-containing protein n=1 Tax=Parascaris univalens TaxID=6257 RepID=A0A915BM76_PARUN
MNALDQCQTVIVQLPAESIVYEWLYGIHTFYRPIHTYLSIFMCAVGTICNFCNIVVLTRKQMRTPVNMILTAMACCDTVVLFSNLIYTTHYTFVAFANCHPRHWSYGWAMFLIAHAHLSLVGHSSSVWLSVMLALIRYMTLRSRGNMKGIQIGLRHSYMAIGFVVLFVAVMNAPNFLTYKIIEMRLNETCEIKDESVRYAPAYIPGVSDMAVQAYCLVFRMAFWISGTVFKVVPCLLLTIFVWLLMKILNEVKQNRLRLMKNSRPSNDGTSSKMEGGDNHSFKQTSHVRCGERTDRTTHMLLAIVFVFLVAELPQGVMAVLSGMFSEEFRRHIYNNLGDILDLLSLCSACTTFIIYCSMSGQFRNEFRRVFLPSSVLCFLSRSNRRSSEPLVKQCYLRPSDAANGNTSTAERSITMSLADSVASLRKVSKGNNPPASVCTDSLQRMGSSDSVDAFPTIKSPPSTAVFNFQSAPTARISSASHETFDDKLDRLDEKAELLSKSCPTKHPCAYMLDNKKKGRILEARYHVV